MSYPIYSYYKWREDGIAGGSGGWLIESRMEVGGTGVEYHFTIFFACAFVISSLTLSVALFRWLEYNGCCLCFFFVFPFFSSFFQTLWIRSYQVSLSKWLDPCVSPDFPIKLTFLDLSFLFQHVELLTNSLRAEFQVYCLSPRFSLRKPRHYNINLDVICWFLVFHGPGQIELLNVAWILPKAEDASSTACTRSQVKVDYFIIPYTSRLNRLSHLYQECHTHYIVITNDKEMR